jgi:rhodanese-related sulfurtransferase
MFWLKYAWLVVLAVISAVVLLWPLVRKALDGATLTPFDITDLINRQGAIVFDLREDSLFKAGHLPRSRHLTLAKLERLDLKRLQQKPLILVGDSQNLRQAKKILQQKGAQRIYIINDNFTAWIEASLP